jgi:hypothetical protein
MTVRSNIAVAVAGLSLLYGCSATTYDQTLETTVEVATTTTLPTGSAGDLLPRLADEAASLSGVMIDGGDASAVGERIAALWDAASTEVNEQRPDLVDGFERSVALSTKAVQYKRAADADKAARNFQALIDAYLNS